MCGIYGRTRKKRPGRFFYSFPLSRQNGIANSRRLFFGAGNGSSRADPFPSSTFHSRVHLRGAGRTFIQEVASRVSEREAASGPKRMPGPGIGRGKYDASVGNPHRYPRSISSCTVAKSRRSPIERGRRKERSPARGGSVPPVRPSVPSWRNW